MRRWASRACKYPRNSSDRRNSGMGMYRGERGVTAGGRFVMVTVAGVERRRRRRDSIFRKDWVASLYNTVRLDR
jgi:hypothetical protein